MARGARSKENSKGKDLASKKQKKLSQNVMSVQGSSHRRLPLDVDQQTSEGKVAKTKTKNEKFEINQKESSMEINFRNDGECSKSLEATKVNKEKTNALEAGTGKKHADQVKIKETNDKPMDIRNVQMRNPEEFDQIQNFSVELADWNQGKLNENTNSINVLHTPVNARAGTVTTPRNCDGNIIKVGNRLNVATRQQNNSVKSPSDTTIYIPGLNQQGEIKSYNRHINLGCGNNEIPGMMSNMAMNRDVSDFNQTAFDQNETVNKISEFLENMRINSTGRQLMDEARPGTTGREMQTVQTKDVGAVGGEIQVEQGRNIADQMVLDAEKFRVAIKKPAGREVVQNIQMFPATTIDDEFFHLTCHIDNALISKIEKGEFVDLERLLPKDPTRRLSAVGDNRMELVNREGGTFFVPVSDREISRISGIRKWEQAFRVYAAIYSKTNPLRAAEIWQYIYYQFSSYFLFMG